MSTSPQSPQSSSNPKQDRQTSLIEVPKNYKDSVQWIKTFETLNTTLAVINKDISELKSLKGTVESFTPQWKTQVESTFSSLQDQQVDTEFRLKVLTNVVIRQDQKIQELESKLTMAYQREIKLNVIIDGILEQDDESREKLLELVKTFFTDTMQIESEVKVSDAYRMGRGLHRSVLVKLAVPSDKAMIFSNVSNLKGKKNARRKLYFIKNDMTTQEMETRNYFKQLLQTIEAQK